MAADKTYSGKVKLPEKKVAKLVIEAEFEMDLPDYLPDILQVVDNAVSELKSYGCVSKAKLSLPATEMDMK